MHTGFTSSPREFGLQFRFAPWHAAFDHEFIIFDTKDVIWFKLPISCWQLKQSIIKEINYASREGSWFKQVRNGWSFECVCVKKLYSNETKWTIVEAQKKSRRRVQTMKILIIVWYLTAKNLWAISSGCKHIEMWTDRKSRYVIEFIVI